MGGELRGHRGPREDRWTWTAGPPSAGPGRGRVLWGTALGAVLAAAGLGLALFFALRSEGGGPLPATPTPAESPSPSVGAGPTATPEAVRLRLAVWSDRGGEWRFADLAPEGSGYREGQAVPFLLRAEGAEAGRTYRLTLRYRCRGDGVAGFDYLTDYRRGFGRAPALADEGPSRLYPDTSIPIPDDASIGLDEREGERLFHLWGGTFQESPQGPEPQGPCRGEKRIVLGIRAVRDTLFLLWGGHLASAADWGEGRGAASLEGPLSMEAGLDGATQAVALLPGAVGEKRSAGRGP